MERDSPYYLDSCPMREVDFRRVSDEFGRGICGTVFHSNNQYPHVLEIFRSMTTIKKFSNFNST